jgi:hypothetical protein
MQIDLCRHVRTNGLQCRAAALTGTPLCHFHTRLHQGHARYRQTPASREYLYLVPGQNIELGPLEDRQSIQVALSQVINALATGKLDPKRATALFYGLQLASTNAAKLFLEPHARDGIRTLHEDSATPGLDLAQPGAIYDTDPPDETFDDEEDEDAEYEQEIQDRVNERLAEIEAQKIENQKLEAQEKNEQPETIPTLQATATTLGAPFMRFHRMSGYRATLDRISSHCHKVPISTAQRPAAIPVASSAAALASRCPKPSALGLTGQRRTWALAPGVCLPYVATNPQQTPIKDSQAQYSQSPQTGDSRSSEQSSSPALFP